MEEIMKLENIQKKLSKIQKFIKSNQENIKRRMS